MSNLLPPEHEQKTIEPHIDHMSTTPSCDESDMLFGQSKIAWLNHMYSSAQRAKR